MRWASESMDDERARKNPAARAKWKRACQWRLWFAWYPVRIQSAKQERFSHQCKQTVWLCFVERRLDAYESMCPPEWFEWEIGHHNYIYRLPHKPTHTSEGSQGTYQMIELAGQMVLSDGTIKDRPTYLDTPQHLWTKEQMEECLMDQQAGLARKPEGHLK